MLFNLQTSQSVHLCIPPLLLSALLLYITPLTSYRYYPHVSSSAVHFRAKEPAVLSDGVALDAAKWVTRTPPAAHTEQNT